MRILQYRRHASVCLLALFCAVLPAQIDSTWLVSGYYGMGSSLPQGSFSKTSQTPNLLGQSGPGLNIKAGAEFYYRHQVFGIDLEYGIFTRTVNDSLNNFVMNRMKSKGAGPVTLLDKEFDLNLAYVALCYGYVFTFGKLAIVPRVGAGRARLGYDYMASDVRIAGSSSTTLVPQSTQYLFNDYTFLCLKPEIGLKYKAKSYKSIDLLTCANFSYFYANPKIQLLEIESGRASSVLTLQDKIQSINMNLAITVVFKQ